MTVDLSKINATSEENLTWLHYAVCDP